MKKILIAVILSILLVVSTVFVYYYSIWSKDQTMESRMKQKALNEVSILKNIEEVHLYAGDEQYYMIIGDDHLGNPLLVWLNEEEIHYQSLKQWISKEEVSMLALNKVPKIVIKRITPGIIDNNMLIYEVLFKTEDGRFGYQYYNLENGQFIKMITLGKSV